MFPKLIVYCTLSYDILVSSLLEAEDNIWVEHYDWNGQVIAFENLIYEINQS